MRKLLALLVILGFVLNVGCDTGKKPSPSKAGGAGAGKMDDGMGAGSDKKTDSSATAKPDEKKPEDKKPDDKKPDDKKPDGAKKGNG